MGTRKRSARKPRENSPKRKKAVVELPATPLDPASQGAWSDDYTIQLELSPRADGKPAARTLAPIRIGGSAAVRQQALHWAYVLRNRARWNRSPEAVAKLESGAVEAMSRLGVGEEELKRIAEADVVQVVVPYRNPDTCWEGRVMPWEFLLTAASKPFRKGRLTVVRQLDSGAAGAAALLPPQVPAKLLFVQSDPGKLKGLYTFGSERRLVSESLGVMELPALIRPTLTQLRDELGEKPDIVHLAGFDLHQGSQFLGYPETAESTQRFDGLFLSGANDAALGYTAEQLAPGLLLGSSHMPRLVVCNFYNSAGRTASLLVAYGARAAIGFQDEIEDELAERFLGHFYRAWKSLNWNILDAFREALASALQQSEQSKGTGIVLWSCDSLLTEARKSTAGQQKKFQHEQSQELDPKTNQPPDLLIASVSANSTVNYALLHNGGGLFKEFRITKLKPGIVRGVEVETILYAGADSFPCRFTLTLAEGIDLRDRIKVPLTSELARSLRESIHTTLYYRVGWGGQDVVRNTERVTLMPIDEWRFDEAYVWLPSFVLSRDKAVQRVLTDARPYLMALKDDFGAGFDGYQSFDAKAGDDEALGVHQQVQALWCGLSYAHNIGYINPPPSFENYSQRLRTPSEVIETGRGTCIDLALLLAACLEYIDVYPVIFLMDGHAFPGYWAGDQYYGEFEGVGEAAADSATQGPSCPNPRKSWIIERDGHAGIVRWIDEGRLVPIESTCLTQHSSFQDAVKEGRRNISHKREFVAMIDVRNARLRTVTPLPVSEVR